MFVWLLFFGFFLFFFVLYFVLFSFFVFFHTVWSQSLHLSLLSLFPFRRFVNPYLSPPPPPPPPPKKKKKKKKNPWFLCTHSAKAYRTTCRSAQAANSINPSRQLNQPKPSTQPTQTANSTNPNRQTHGQSLACDWMHASTMQHRVALQALSVKKLFIKSPRWRQAWLPRSVISCLLHSSRLHFSFFFSSSCLLFSRSSSCEFEWVWLCIFFLFCCFFFKFQLGIWKSLWLCIPPVLRKSGVVSECLAD